MQPSRRVFLSQLLALVPLSRYEAGSPEPEPEFVLGDFRVAGLHYHAPAGLLLRMRVGEVVEARAEPENPYDRSAVRLLYREAQIGYMPRQENRTVALLLAQGAPVRGTVSAVDPDAVPWEAVRVRLAVRMPPA